MTQVGVGDTVANLRRMQALCLDAEWVWFTPVPVCEERVAQLPPFRFGGSACATTTSARSPTRRHGRRPRRRVGVPADPVLQGADGVHVTLEGQSAIARAIVERPATAGRPGSA